jgi:hypothetical protein
MAPSPSSSYDGIGSDGPIKRPLFSVFFVGVVKDSTFWGDMDQLRKERILAQSKNSKWNNPDL